VGADATTRKHTIVSLTTSRECSSFSAAETPRGSVMSVSAYAVTCGIVVTQLRPGSEPRYAGSAREFTRSTGRKFRRLIDGPGGQLSSSSTGPRPEADFAAGAACSDGAACSARSGTPQRGPLQAARVESNPSEVLARDPALATAARRDSGCNRTPSVPGRGRGQPGSQRRPQVGLKRNGIVLVWLSSDSKDSGGGFGLERRPTVGSADSLVSAR